MDKTLEALCSSLDKLANFVESRSDDNRPLTQTHGWTLPSITPKQLASIPKMLSEEIRKSDIDTIPAELAEMLANMPSQLFTLQQTTLPQLFNQQAVDAYMSTIQWISNSVRPILYWESMNDPKAMPPILAKKLRETKKQFDEISIDKKQLLNQIALINEATETAESLPTDLLSLKEARKKISDLSKESRLDRDMINQLKEVSIEHEKAINSNIAKSDKLISQCEEAYRITTTKGLAGAFETRASKLSTSMRWWVFALLLSLLLAAYIGKTRLDILTEAMSLPQPNMSMLALQSILSALSIFAPLWFSWLATKQIKQLFKLSEDYAFKASVAKAYEGYRKEAASIDEKFAYKLFESALDRLDEPPLRFLDSETHSSPLHEFTNSIGFNKQSSKLKKKVANSDKKKRDEIESEEEDVA